MPRKAAKAETPPLSLEKIDVPLEVIALPVGDPALLVAIGQAFTQKKSSVNVQGAVTQGDRKYDVNLQVKKNDTFNYDLKGKIGTMDVSLHAEKPLLWPSINVTGKIGANKVDLSNTLNLITWNVSTEGKVGSVSLDLTSDTDKEKKKTITRGKIGAMPFYNEVSAGTEVKQSHGTLGEVKIDGTGRETAPGHFVSHNVMGDVASSYQVEGQ
ncbi:MAG: hypothetical protein RDV48_24405 [Candidatus Eremiobacteraeota bacterium]|nr:hypothetical protein [Candidatus Eremiobacteraeota bacterium]